MVITIWLPTCHMLHHDCDALVSHAVEIQICVYHIYMFDPLTINFVMSRSQKFFYVM